MDNATVETPGTVALEPPSTVLNPETVKTISGGGKPDLNDKGNSIQSVLEGELARLKDEDKASKPADEKATKPDEKAEQEKPTDDKAAKPDKARADDGKFAKAEKPEETPEAKADKGAAEKPATERSAPDEPRQSEGRKYAEPPARFLPEARTKWANVPNEVKAEFHRVMQEVDTEREQSRQAIEAYESVKQYDEMAKRSGTTMADAMGRYVNMENMLRQNPAQGMAILLNRLGLTPQQYAEHVLKNPQAHQFAPQQQPAQAQAPRVDPNVEALKAEVTSLRAELTVAPVIQRFAADHPDFNDVGPAMKSILDSGVIEQLYGNGLSLEQRLSEAYRMAGGSPLPSRSGPETLTAHSAPPPVRPVDPDGQKSIRGAPADGADSAVEEASSDLHEMLRKEIRRMSA